MSHFADFQPYPQYEGDEATRAIGWLESGQDFSTGRLDLHILSRLVQLVKGGWQATYKLGWHDCSLCGQAKGSRNLFVPGSNCVFVVPELILHYIQHHQYLPPPVFQEATLACPIPGSRAYFKALRASGLDLIRVSLPPHQSWASSLELWGVTPEDFSRKMELRAKELRQLYFSDEP